MARTWQYRFGGPGSKPGDFFSGVFCACFFFHLSDWYLGHIFSHV